MEKVLVLNSDYTPLNVTTMRRGFVLVDKGKAEVLKKDENPIITTIGNFVRPMVTCCFDCNSRKGSKTPEEAGLKFRVRPYRPSVFSELVAGRAAHIWEEFQQDFFSYPK